MAAVGQDALTLGISQTFFRVAWSVAGGVYGDLLKSGLKIDHPERL